MSSPHLARIELLQGRLRDQGLDGAIFTDPDSLYWFSGYWGYASLVSCGRPNILWVSVNDEPEIITPSMELEMCQNLTPVVRIRGWIDGIDGEWMKPFGEVLRRPGVRRIGIEVDRMPGLVLNFLRQNHSDLNLIDVGAIAGAMRTIKTDAEIRIMRQAGEVAVAMVEGARAAIGVGVPEYEISLAATAAGTRKAAEFLDGEAPEPFFSPMIYNLQIMQSGRHTCMVHRRPTVRRIERGDPVYLCFCGITVFKGYWLGFDREFFVGTVTDEQARLYDVTIKAQLAALGAIRPGVAAEDVHFAANEVYLQAGFPPTYRTGRGTGTSILERPELKAGDRTPLQPGMTFAVDGGLTLPGKFGARVGDSIVVTAQGFDYLTPYPKNLMIV
ncbi:MAG: aminopeptidase P family protein [Rhodospirillales bacterium]|nr:aminopeptidase P family protein [Rhodospirillales bacterium]